MLLHSDYFVDDATNTPKEFQRRFRMSKGLFMKIVQGVREYDDYFKYKKDCTEKWGFTSVQKCTNAVHCIWSSTGYSSGLSMHGQVDIYR
jgi:uncharacterized Ntn-hydrolase superfamily protein